MPTRRPNPRPRGSTFVFDSSSVTFLLANRGRGSAAPLPARSSQGLRVAFTRPDADQPVECDGTDLAVADLPGAAGVDDRVDDLVGVRGVAHDLELHLGEK